MYLTITPNASLDRLLFIQEFMPTTVMRTHKSFDAVGGKGFDISVALRCLGQETVATGFIAGPTGQLLQERLTSYGIQLDLVEVAGDTRIAHVIVEEARHRHSHVTTQGFEVTPQDYNAFLETYRRRLPEARWAAAGGSLAKGLPITFYKEITQVAHAHHVPVLIDVPDEPARLALSAQPEIVKMNRREYQSTFAVELHQVEELIEHAKKMLQTHRMGALVITCGEDGILVVTPSGSFQAQGPALQEINAAGAGDAVSATLIWRLSMGDDWEAALRHAAAVGSATVLTEHTAEHDRQTVQEIYPQINVIRR